LKCNYWDSQAKATLDAQLEISSVLHDIAQILKDKGTGNGKPGSIISNIQKLVASFVRVFPIELRVISLRASYFFNSSLVQEAMNFLLIALVVY
jgi:hypothetical protein